MKKQVRTGTRKCPHCDKVYQRGSGIQIREHITMEHGDGGQFICENCNRKFGSGARLRDHIKQVHTRVTCDLCQEVLYNTFYLRKHKAYVHGIVPANSFKCQFCPEFFKHEIMLQKHVGSNHI